MHDSLILSVYSARPSFFPLALTVDCTVLSPTPSGPSPLRMVLRYGSDHDPPLGSVLIAWASCMVLSWTHSGPVRNCKALLHGSAPDSLCPSLHPTAPLSAPAPDPLWAPSSCGHEPDLLWVFPLSHDLLYGPEPVSLKGPLLIAWSCFMILISTPSGPSPHRVALLYNPEPDLQALTSSHGLWNAIRQVQVFRSIALMCVGICWSVSYKSPPHDFTCTSGTVSDIGQRPHVVKVYVGFVSWILLSMT